MKIFKRKTDINLYETGVENLFISEDMIQADGIYVKVYLYAKMYLDLGESIRNETISRDLSLTLKQVEDSWNYWESKHIIIKHYTGPDPSDFDVEFVSLRQRMYGSDVYSAPAEETESSAEAVKRLNSAVFSDSALSLFSSVEKLCGRHLSHKEMDSLRLWLEDMDMSEQVILKAYDICINERKKSPELSYITAIINSWYENRLSRIDRLEEYLSDHDRKHNAYRRIFRALGFVGRYPSEEEKRIMNIWLDDYGLDISAILEACRKSSGVASPSINYVHAILKDWHGKDRLRPDGTKKSSPAEITRFYEELRNKNKKIFDSRRTAVLRKIPRLGEIESELGELSAGRMKLILERKNRSPEYSKLEADMNALKQERITLLGKAGHPADYLDPIYHCKHCRDTGYLDNGEKCVCQIEHKL